jgi:hypothetical protein
MIRAILIASIFVLVFYLAGIISNGNVAVQIAALCIFGLVIVWNAMKVICCACNQGNKSHCTPEKKRGHSTFS